MASARRSQLGALPACAWPACVVRDMDQPLSVPPQAMAINPRRLPTPADATVADADAAAVAHFADTAVCRHRRQKATSCMPLSIPTSPPPPPLLHHILITPRIRHNCRARDYIHTVYISTHATNPAQTQSFPPGYKRQEPPSPPYHRTAQTHRACRSSHSA